MTGRHAGQLRIDDVGLSDRIRACQEQITSHFAAQATRPASPDISSAWRATTEAHIKELQLLQRAQAILAEVLIEHG